MADDSPSLPFLPAPDRPPASEPLEPLPAPPPSTPVGVRRAGLFVLLGLAVGAGGVLLGAALVSHPTRTVTVTPAGDIATNIAANTPNAAANPCTNVQSRAAAAGTVASNDGHTITITDPRGGTRKVAISSATKVHKVASGTTRDLKVGSLIAAGGATGSDGTLTANRVVVLPPGSASNPLLRLGLGRLRGPTGASLGKLPGTITAVTGSTLTVKDASGATHQVVVNSSTVITTIVDGKLSDAAPGTRIAALGSPNSDGSLTATDIVTLPANANLPFGGLGPGIFGGPGPFGGRRYSRFGGPGDGAGGGAVSPSPTTVPSSTAAPAV